MGTRCYIGMVCDDGTIKAVYCSHDGYPSGVGATLLNHYQAKEKAEKLLELNGFSGLEPTVEKTKEQEYEDGEKEEIIPNEEKFLQIHTDSDTAYAYLLKDGLWYVAGSVEGREFVPLTRKIIEDDK